MRSARLVLASALCVAALGASRRAAAYPQFQFSSGTSRCNQCHFAPAGGGLINGWGRDEAGDTISRGGSGAFLHGLWDPPSWLALGGDFRGVTMLNDVNDPDPPELLAFPMQADLYARTAFGESWSLMLAGGLRGNARNPDPRPSIASRLASREHYVMWRPKTTGPYVRAGKFFAPYGLRLVEHPTYIRRYLGFNIFDETYGVSGGVVKEDWELHVSGFGPDYLQGPIGPRAFGGAAYFEKHLGETSAVGGQARVAVAPDDDTRIQGGVVGKVYLPGPRLMLMAEADAVWQTFANIAGESRGQLVGYLGATLFPIKGLMTAVVLEHFDEDIGIKNVDRDAASVQINFFPWAHLEFILLGRIQTLGFGEGGPTSRLGMLQLHYYP